MDSLIDFLSMVTWAFVLSRCEAERCVVVRALAGCNLSRAAVCGNYLLHGSAVGNRYLYPGCQTIGFPPLTLSDIRWSSAVCVCVWEYVHSVCVQILCAYVCVVVRERCTRAYSQLCVLSSCLPTCVKVKDVILSRAAVCRRGLGHVATGDEVKESPGRWQPVSHTARATLSSVAKTWRCCPQSKS